jgi:hypothetical protein
MSLPGLSDSQNSDLHPVSGRAAPVRSAIGGATTARLNINAAAAHRIRTGLTGLAAIFLLVMFAAAGLRPSPTAVAVEAPAEPLAMLGVAPGANTAPAVQPVAAPAAARRRLPQP